MKNFCARSFCRKRGWFSLLIASVVSPSGLGVVTLSDSSNHSSDLQQSQITEAEDGDSGDEDSAAETGTNLHASPLMLVFCRNSLCKKYYVNGTQPKVQE